MKFVLKSLVLLVVLVVVAVVGGAYLIPPVAVVERATQVRASADTVYGIISNTKVFNVWPPWAELDPDTTYTFDGPNGGVGQKMTWASKDPSIGKGTLTLIKAEPGHEVVTALDLGGMGAATVTIALKPLDDGVAVVWTFEKPLDGILERWASLQFDSQVGGDIVKGLTRLKALAEEENTDG